MKIVLERYYGDWRITKSVMTVFADGAVDGASEVAPRVLLRCEAREPRFAQYVEAFPGCSKCCLACGEFDCKVLATDMSPMTLTVIKSPGHRCCRIGWDYVAQVKSNTVLVGESDGHEVEEYRDMVHSKEVFERLEALVYGAYASGERIRLVVRNKVLYLNGELFDDANIGSCNDYRF